MAEPLMPSFRQPGSYVRYFGTNIFDPNDQNQQIRFIRLLQRDNPLRYYYKFGASVAVDAVSGDVVSFPDLEPAGIHLYQSFLGVSPGIRLRVFMPSNTRLLSFDQTIATIDPTQTAVITHGLSPYENPQFEVWVPPRKNLPGVIAQNATADIMGIPGGKTIVPRIIFLIARYSYEMVDPVKEPDIFNRLSTKAIDSYPVSFGGSVRVNP